MISRLVRGASVWGPERVDRVLYVWQELLVRVLDRLPFENDVKQSLRARARVLAALTWPSLRSAIRSRNESSFSSAI